MKRAITTDVTRNTPSIHFSDINLYAGTITPFSIVTEADSVNQNVLVILGTPKKSWWFGPNKGSYVGRYLFDPMDDITAHKIKSEIRDALIENGEYRIDILDMSVVPNLEQQEYYVDMYYNLPELALVNIPFSFNLAKEL